MQQLIATLEAKSNAELAAQYNEAFEQLQNKGKFKPVNGRFADKKSAVARTVAILIALDQEQPEAPAPVEAKQPELDLDEPMVEVTMVGDEVVEVKQAYDVKAQPEVETVEKPKKGGAKRGINLKPSGYRILPCREGSKQAILLDLLAQENGTTIEELMGALGWTKSSVYSGFGWDMKNKGYGVRSEMIDGVERFFIVVPEGEEITAHTPVKKKAETKPKQ